MLPKWYYILWNRLSWISLAVLVVFLIVACILAFIFHIYVSGSLYWCVPDALQSLPRALPFGVTEW